MAGIVAIVLPPGPASEPVAHLIRRLHLMPSRFRPVVFGPPGRGAVAEIVHRTVGLPWRLGGAQHRYALRAAELLARLRPTVIEVHDAPLVASLLGARFRPIPVILVTHSDPQALRGARDPAARTYLLAQVTRVAALSADLRARLLEGVHPSMRHCTLLPSPDAEAGAAATADALDALRLDALKAWSRPLHEPI